MTVTISGTTGIAGVDGSAATPAVQGVDTNTGVFYGTDIVAISTGGTERVRVNASGQAEFTAGTAALPAITSTGDTNTGIFFPAADTIAFAEGGAEAMRIDSSGNVGIGTASPSTKLEVYASTGTLQIQSIVRNDNTGSGVAAIGFNVAGSAGAEATSTKAGIGLVRSAAFGGGSLAFYNNNSGAAGDFTTADEKMRISPDGFVFINQTAQKGNTIQRVGIQFAANVEWGLNITNSTTTTGNAINFTNSSGTQIGQIQNTTSATSYVTSSDYRLKENVAPITTGLTTISALKPVSYDWIGDKSHGEGFIAHELQELVPLAVTGQKDAVDSNGNPVHQGVDYSKIVVHLVAAIQEQQAMITALTARITALEVTP